LKIKENQLIESLDKLRKQEIANKETWKARAYSIIIKELKAFEQPIYTHDIKDLKGIGKKSSEAKIKELLELYYPN
jgi:ABC-type phosphate transport system auxiliary subunit